MTLRSDTWETIRDMSFDVIIIGAGINGASTFRRLSSLGYRVLIIDKGDFSCGTSQASAMMIWGGLLYLSNLDIRAVRGFSKDRDELIRIHADHIRSVKFRYVIGTENARSKTLLNSALHLYWLLGLFKRTMPQYRRQYSELSFIREDVQKGSVTFEEGMLNNSDSRFVLDWILDYQSERSLAMNYCELLDCSYNRLDRQWTISLSDRLSGGQCSVTAKYIVNCAGVWTDLVNEQFKIQSPYRHAFSKGVFIGFERPHSHQSPLVFEMGQHGDTLTLIPWGPISLWGPTETMVHSVEDGFRIDKNDVSFLLEHARRHLKRHVTNSRIVSLRCGVRPLAVKKGFKADCYPLMLSRRHKVVTDRLVPWISVYGGKISGCLSLANTVAAHLPGKRATGAGGPPSQRQQKKIGLSTYPGLKQPVPSIEWCVENEFCCTLTDYLRRRTNIAQWVSREGLGFDNENIGYLARLCKLLPGMEKNSPLHHLRAYIAKVQTEFDQLTGKGEPYEAA